ncbi:MAG: hypothetical protein KUG79_14265 [Pseudomonadales bacterium]|nr:hypothetical protein [Pseudomonadales bacterium]
MARPKKKAAKDGVDSKEPSIEVMTAAFLASGGVIEQIPTGLSGQAGMAASKHINLGSKKEAPAAQPKTEPVK